MKKDFKLNTLVRPGVLKMNAYASARDEFTTQGREMIFLDANENPFENGVNRYPDPQQGKLKALIAAQKGISENNILLGNGSDEILDLIFRVFCRPGKDNVISLPPTYGMYRVLADLNDIEDREVILSQDFQPEADEIIQRADANTKIVFLCSPNNPTGNSFSQQAVEKILLNFTGLVVIDEAYIDFAAQKSWLSKLSEFPNLIITQTLSKAYGMAGIRLGICYASTEIISLLNKIKPPYNVNELTQQKALEKLCRTDILKQEVETILEQREQLEKSLAELPFIEKIFPSDANFLLVRVDNAQKRYQQLLDCAVVVRNRSKQPLCDNTLRISIGTPQQNELLMEKLKNLEL